jgi:hypothetical protein
MGREGCEAIPEELFQLIHGNRKVQVLPFPKKPHANPDDLALAVEEGPTAAAG